MDRYCENNKNQLFNGNVIQRLVSSVCGARTRENTLLDMTTVLVILVLFVGVIFHYGDTKRIDKARVTFSTIDKGAVQQWEKLFENASNKPKKGEACKNLASKVVSDDEISRCVRFTMFCRSNTEGTQLKINDQVQLKNSGFNPKNPTVILIHGFFHTHEKTGETWMETMRNAFLGLVDVNVMLVQWSPLSHHFYYPLVVQNAAKVAGYLSRLISLMVEEGADLKKVHIVGHSLGAHIGGMASQNLSEGIVGRITGLDPAGPLFLNGHDSTRLDRSDADYVDCVHTNHGFLGISSPVCHADFFMNGGRVQPGCCEWVNVGKCGHLRSTTYFIESISKSVKFEAYSCATVPDLDPVNCFESGAVMGFPANTSFQGIFYVETGMENPFHKVPPKKKLAELEAQCFSTFPFTWILDSLS